jgi:hypothetical protein
MLRYLVLSYSNLDELSREVNQKQDEGWCPQGGIVVIPGIEGYIFLQAVTKEEEGGIIQVSGGKPKTATVRVSPLQLRDSAFNCP